jgi:circadian clock protein KaiC
MLSLLRYLSEQGGTALFTSEAQDATDEDLQFISDGIIQLNFTPDNRSLCVTKFRGSDFRSGRHSMRLSSSGIEVFPQLMPKALGQPFVVEALPSGIPELDEMLGGGIERGTITIITGPSGVGKSSLGLQFLKQAAERGECSVVYVFEEPMETLLQRCEAIQIPVRQMIERGLLAAVQVEPLRLTADQFAVIARQEVEEKKARIVMIDSIAGYRLSLGGEELVSRLHALAKYLQSMGVAVLLINEVETVTGDFRVTELGVSYMADNIIFLRYLEMKGEIHKAIGVLKKRLTDFEKTVRELDITSKGLKLGKPLTKLRGILHGTPTFVELPFDL